MILIVTDDDSTWTIILQQQHCLLMMTVDNTADLVGCYDLTAFNYRVEYLGNDDMKYASLPFWRL